MDLKDVRRIKVYRKKRRRVGRGQGSGTGTTSGRGHKGAGQRSGNVIRLHFEGGQMPIQRRLPKKGFSNARFKLRFHVVNVGDLDSRFDAGAKIDLDSLKVAGLAPKKARFWKVLGWGDVTKALTVEAHGVSDGARKKLEDASGSVTILPTKPAARPKGVKKQKPQAVDAEASGGMP